MIIVVNGPLGIGKSTLSEALLERIERCAMLDGDAMVAVNPAPQDPVGHFHEGLLLLLEHHRRHGYRNFVINHLWETAAHLDTLCRALARDDEKVFRFRLTLDPMANLARIGRRAQARELDELAHDCREYWREYSVLDAATGNALGEPLAADAAPWALADIVMRRTHCS